MTTDTWHHVALVCDGVEDARTATTGQIAISAYNLYIGANAQQAGRYFRGQLDDVRIYSRALSPEEIAGLAGRVQPVQKPV